MNAPPRALGDALLAAFAVGVVAASVMVVKQADAPAAVSTVSQGDSRPVAQVHRPSPLPPVTVALPTPSTTPSAEASDGPAAVVVAGPDLAKLGSELVAASGDTVLVAESKGQQPLADGALAGIEQTPAAVIVEVLAGSQTSVRTTDAVTAIRKRWAKVPILVIGPFSSADRKSAAAVQAAAEAMHVRFLDPVALKWRADDASPVVGVSDFSSIAAKIAAALK